MRCGCQIAEFDLTTAEHTSENTAIVSVAIEKEHDIVAARQRARQIATLLGFAQQDQVRIATAVSEVARNAYQYGRGGLVNFSLDLQSRPQLFWVQVRDQGPGIADVQAVLAEGYRSQNGMGIGLAGSKRLLDEFRVQSKPGQGTTVWMGKAIPPAALPLDKSAVGRICRTLVQQHPDLETHKELERQNRELLLTLDALRTREAELDRRREELARLNVELEETNRGVVALYAELEEKAISLRRADEMKSRFLSHVSHEFRTPVNSVLALTQLLLQRADGDLTSEQEKQISYVRDAAQQLADIVNDLLDLAKVDAGKTELRITRVDVAQFLGSIRALMKPLATSPDVVLIFEEPAAGLDLDSDESKLGQIVRNLISNALKFTQQGEVRVCAEGSADGNVLRFKVKDSGIGIAPEDQERIFQEFAQIDGPLQRRVKGTGLGLPLSRKLATLLGGTLAVESETGAGSLFTLTLPRQAETAAEEERLADERAAKTILIVDDDATARYLMRRLLRGSRYQIVEATGAEAAERARFDKPALVILDLMMPDRSGFEVLQELRAHETTRHVPIVIHTSKALTEADYARLGGEHAAVLPKGADGRLPALMAIRRILSEPGLFASEPEIKD